MPLTHVRPFRLRYYECDALGYAHAATYARLMQEAAFDASAAAGYDLARYEAMGRLWLIHETEIDLLSPLRYGDRVQVKTWVADFRRVRSRRAYEFRLEGSDEPLARASTDWAFVDRATGRPAPIPEEMVAAFWPEGSPGTAPARPRGSPVPAPPASALRVRRRVQWLDLDQAGHVNNAVYLAYLEDTAVQAATAAGWPPDRCGAAGFRVAARHFQVQYAQPALLGDELELVTWTTAPLEGCAERFFVIGRPSDKAQVARARCRWTCLALGDGMPAPIPAGLSAGAEEPAQREVTG